MGSAKPPIACLRYSGEAERCPACDSSRLVLIEPVKISRDRSGRRVTFLTGCRACGLLFANPLPSTDELERQYAPDGSWREGRKSRAAKPKLRPSAGRDPRDVLLKALGGLVPVEMPPSGARVLDFGCGDGKFLDRLQDAGWETYGIEPSTKVAFTRHRQLVEIPQDGSFDFAIVHHVLEHVTEPLRILQQLAGAVRLGGYLFVSIPSLDGLPRHRDLKYCIDGRRHLVALTEACLRGLLSRSGFAVLAKLDSEALNRELTRGLPLRLRLVARRTIEAQPLPVEPLAPALAALRMYRRHEPGVGGRYGHLIPVRARGAWLDRAIERRARARRRARERSADETIGRHG